MSNFFDRYVYGSLIGEGGFGKVYSASRKIDDMKVAIKRARIRSSTKFILDFDKIPLEIYILKKLHPVPGVVKMLDYHVGLKHYYIVMEFVSPDLSEAMKVYKFFKEDLCKKLFKNVMDTIIICKEHGVVHNDIKLENVSWNIHESTLKLLDFGLADFDSSKYSLKFRGTPEFAPPEWTDFKLYHREKATVWTLGLLLYEMSQNCFPNTLDSAKKLSFVVPISSTMQHFIRRCLSRNRRPTLNKLRDHEWLKE